MCLWGKVDYSGLHQDKHMLTTIIILLSNHIHIIWWKEIWYVCAEVGLLQSHIPGAVLLSENDTFYPLFYFTQVRFPYKSEYTCTAYGHIYCCVSLCLQCSTKFTSRKLDCVTNCEKKKMLNAVIFHQRERISSLRGRWMTEHYMGLWIFHKSIWGPQRDSNGMQMQLSHRG